MVKPLTGLILTGSVFFIGDGMLIPLIPLFSKELGADIALVGLIVAANTMGSTILSIPLGIASDRVGRKPIIILATIFVGSASFALAFATHPLHILVLWALSGLSISAYRPAASAYIRDVADMRRLGTAYGLYATIEGMTDALGPGIGGVVAEVFGFPTAFLLAGIFAYAGGAVAVVTLASGKPKVNPTATTTPGVKPVAARRVNHRQMTSSYLFIFGFGFATNSANAFLPLYAKELGLGVATIGLLFSMRQLGNIAVRLPAGLLSDRATSRVKVTMSGMLLVVVGVGLLPLGRDFASLAVLSFVTGSARAAVITSERARVGSMTEGGGVGLAMGTFETFMGGGRVAGPALLGPLASASGFPIAFIFAAVFAGLMSLVARASVAPKSRGQSNDG